MMVKRRSLKKEVSLTDDEIRKLDEEADTDQKRLIFLEDENRQLRSRLRAQDLVEARTQMLLDCIREKKIALPTLKLEKLKPVRKAEEEMSVLHLSDIHAGELVVAEEISNLNEYNLKIMDKRIQQIGTKIMKIHSILAPAYNLKKLKVYGLGDFVSGIIHDELVQNADGDLTDWLFECSKSVASLLIRLSQIYEEIEFIGVVGNHGRMTKKVAFKKKYVNWDYICYHTIALMCAKEPRIKFNIPRSFFYIDKIYDFTFLVLHGDIVTSWNGIPWYGIQRAITRFDQLLASQKRFADYVALAHFHGTGTLQRTGGDILLNGSVIGANEFSVGALAAANKAHQLFHGVHEKMGISFMYQLRLE